MRKTLELLTNLAVLIVALAIIATLVVNFYEHKRTPTLQSGLARGQILPALGNLDYGASPETLIIALDARCTYCRESIPFYNKIIQANINQRSTTRIFAVFPNQKEEVESFVKQNNFNINTIPSVNFNAVKLRGTPIMILVDSSGRVKNFWVGKIPQEEEIALINNLFTVR